MRRQEDAAELTDIDQIFVSRVLEVVCAGHRDVTYITGLEIERSTRFGRYVDGQAALAADDVVPFVAGGVPVQLAHGSWLDGEKRCGEVAGDWEGLRVDDLETSAGHFVGLLLAEVVAVSICK